MKLKEIVSEHFYLVDTEYKPSMPFKEQDSNVRDYYCRLASDELAKIIPSYLGNNGLITNIIRGSIKSFINAHGYELNKNNSESLVKRIIGNIRKGQVLKNQG